jgi:class 3 adenylate cyclase/tetratricopeptide (TPR) repeat protein
MSSYEVYIPRDRRRALAAGGSLPDRAAGAALFADLSDFTPLTADLTREYGPHRGAEELTRFLNRVFTALVAEVHAHGGSVVSFSGDAITCWFADEPPGAAQRAAACAWAIQEAAAGLGAGAGPDRPARPVSVKVSIAAGPVRRFVVGRPSVQLIDLLAGATVDRLAAVEQIARPGEVLASAEALAQLPAPAAVREWRDGPDGVRAAVLAAPPPPVALDRAGSAPVPGEQARAWVLPAVYGRLQQGLGPFLAEFRPAVALFLRFGGIDYDADDEAGARLCAYIAWVQDVLAHYDGALLQVTTGDKGSYLYAAFGAPIAHEDDVRRALAAALELMAPPAELAFVGPARAGISRGLMWAGEYGGADRRTYGVMGNDVNVAARLMSTAQPGQILTTRRLEERAAPFFELRALPPVAIKGFAAPLAVFEVLGRRAAPAAPQQELPAMVGRDGERRALLARLDGLLGGDGGVVLIEGEAGIGKSRLLDELGAAARRRGIRCLSGAGSGVEQSTLYHAWRPVVEELLGPLPESPEERAAAVAAALRAALAGADLPADAGELAPLLGAVLPLELPDSVASAALSGQVRAEVTRDLLAGLLRRAAESPAILLIEDAHWLDSASWSLLQRVVAGVPALLAVVATRPLDEPASPEYAALCAAPGGLVLRLGPLAADDLLHLARRHLNVRELPEPAAALIVDRAGGNPFFCEEIAFALRDTGVLRIEGEHCDLAPGAGDQAALAFPDTLHGVIASRIDRLMPSQQVTIKVASAIGRQFSYSALADLYPIPGDRPHLDFDLDVLARRELTPLAALEPERSYIFKHVITQEVAYNMMLFAQRQQLHERIGEWYERTIGDELDANAAVLAHHWTQAAAAPADSPRALRQAIRYSRRAGDHAARNNAHVEASRQFARVIELLGRLPPSIDCDQEELAAQTALGYALMNQRGYGDPEVERAYRRAEELSRVTGLAQTARLGPILYGLLSFYASRGEYGPAERVAAQILDLADDLADPGLRLIGLNGVGLCAVLRGDPAAGLGPTGASFALADEHQDAALILDYGGDFRGYPRAWHSIAQTLLGLPDQGRRTLEQTLELTRSHPYTYGFMLCFGVSPLLCRDVAATMRYADDLGALAARYSFPLLMLVANIHKGWALSQGGQAAAGAELIAGGLPVMRAIKLDSFLPFYLALHAEALAACGQLEAALASADEGLALAAAAGGSFYAPELRRLRGELLRAGGERGAAKAAFEEAIEHARRQGARWWELRAAWNLAALAAEEGDAPPLAALASLVATFAEGHTTDDLTRARQLLAGATWRT